MAPEGNGGKKPRKRVAPFAALAAFVCLGAAGLVLWWQGQLPIPAIEKLPIPALERLPGAIESLMPGAPAPELAERAPEGEETKPSTTVEETQADTTATVNEVTGAVRPEVAMEGQPSFDIVRIEPSGEGVVAGRAQPGWQVSIESGSTKVAEATADSHGEWTVVFEEPLSAGDHNLTLRAVSPDGTGALASTQSVAAVIPEPAVRTAARPETPGVEARQSAGATPQEAALGAAIAGRQVAPSSAAASRAAPLPQTAAIEEESRVPPDPLAEQRKPDVYTILPGDTLWDIAQRYLGAGWRYPSIHRGNSDIIRNPNLIHPEQRVKLPEESEDGASTP